jgi:hypothetical protein
MAELTDINSWLQILNYMSLGGDIKVPSTYHARCKSIKNMLASDTTGLINVILNFSIDSASEPTYKIETKNQELDRVLNKWLSSLNKNHRGKVPTGINALSKEYFIERWKGSSLCILQATDWTEVEGILLPQTVYFVDGASVYVKSGDSAIVKLGDFSYFLDKNEEIPLKDTDENTVIIQKPFSRWHVKYPVPYLVMIGVLRNFLGLDLLKEKGEDVLKKMLPYLLFLTKGNNEQSRAGVTYDDTDLAPLVSGFKTWLADYKSNAKENPMYAAPYDTNLQHIIPDIRNIFSRDLTETGERAIISSLGFISVVQGVGDSRKEEVLNPKPYIAGVNAGVRDFKSIIHELVEIIIEKNIGSHKKYFSKNNEILVTNTPLKLNIQTILDAIRQSFAYGASSIKTYQEALGLDPKIEKERRKQELDSGDEDLFAPHLIQVQQQFPRPGEESETVIPNSKTSVPSKKVPVTKKQEEKNNEKNKMKASVRCERCNESFDYATEPEVSMGSVKCPSCGLNVNQEGKGNVEASEIITAPYNSLIDLPPAVKKLSKKLQQLWMRVFNDTYKRNAGKENKEAVSFRTAWFVVNRKRKNK